MSEPNYPERIRKVQAAMGQGDLSENAEYESAKNRQSTMQARFAQIQKRLAGASGEAQEALLAEKTRLVRQMTGL